MQVRSYNKCKGTTIFIHVQYLDSAVVNRPVQIKSIKFIFIS